MSFRINGNWNFETVFEFCLVINSYQFFTFSELETCRICFLSCFSTCWIDNNFFTENCIKCLGYCFIICTLESNCSCLMII